MDYIPNWYTKVLEVADHDFAIRLLKLKMAVKNYIYLSILYSFKRYLCHADPPCLRGIIMLSKNELADTILRLKILKIFRYF